MEKVAGSAQIIFCSLFFRKECDFQNGKNREKYTERERTHYRSRNHAALNELESLSPREELEVPVAVTPKPGLEVFMQ